MSFNNRSKIIFITSLFIIFFLPSLLFSQISLTIGDASGRLGDKMIPLDIKITNQSDTIAAYNIWLKLDRPDLVKFQSTEVLVYDSSYWKCTQYAGADCIDSTKVYSYDAWDFLHLDSSFQMEYFYEESSYIMPDWLTFTRSLSGSGHDLNLVSINIQGVEPYIYPSPDEELLIRLYLEVVDSLPIEVVDSVVNFHLGMSFINHFSFSNHKGELIGRDNYIYPDSTCFICWEWVDSECIYWVEWHGDPGPVEIDSSNCDSIRIVIDTATVLDTTYFDIIEGSFTLLPSCGYSLATEDYDISNLVALVDFIFTNGPTLTNAEADFSCDCEIDITDLVGFVDFVFIGGDAPSCATQ